MEKRKKWHLYLILSVILLTLVHVFPTILYYSKPLSEPVSKEMGAEIGARIVERVNGMQGESIDWVRAFCRLIRVKPVAVVSEKETPQMIRVQFSAEEEARRFKQYFPRAGSLIPFAPAQLELGISEEHEKTVFVQRKIPLDLKPEMFSFIEKGSEAYRQTIIERAKQLGTAVAGSLEGAKSLDATGSWYIGSANPYFSDVTIHWEEGFISLSLSPKSKENLPPEEKQKLLDEIAGISRLTGETIREERGEYKASFHQKEGTTGLLVFDSRAALSQMMKQTIAYVESAWHPGHPDLRACSIVDFATYQILPPEKKALCLVVYAPVLFDSAPSTFQKDSLYCFAKGLQRIANQYEAFPDSDIAKQFQKELRELQRLLIQAGFIPYAAPSAEVLEGLSSDIVFEQRQSLQPLVAGTRETFLMRGAKREPVLELSTQEERILTENAIETAAHRDLLKWQDEYNAAQVRPDTLARAEVPKPTKSVLWNHAKLELRKFFRGDAQKVIRWGLDLSGGKTVQIELRDANGQLVTSDLDIKRGINELYQRINKKGVSEISIRQVGNQIVLDFPGSQALSGAELVHASTMFFHVVNETFSHPASPHAEVANRFLREVWNEAQVTGKTGEKQIQEIAWNHLHGEKNEARSEAARTLAERGLRLASPQHTVKSSAIDSTLSTIAIYRGSDPTEWHGQSHPLLIVFNNYALEGSQLEDVRASYDPSKGNFLSFNIQKTTTLSDGTVKNPSQELHAWTSRFSKSAIAGTEEANISRGHGWRMAVVLNDSIISCPTLNEPLQDSAMISGSFSQREVTSLAADLRAGSLTFTPHILSEKNVSPELGKADRARGIGATIAALLLVIASMTLYYRFAGLIASIAVLFNILIMWAALQHIGAALTLAGLAGLILTVGMAVDANVLVFERIKEEFARTSHLRSAIISGYKKAFSAILDSNITTIIAALILLQFDAGPIKAFAITLIIGIASSMFTALFMTRYYFSSWLQKTKSTSLSMANWIRGSHFNFLKWGKTALLSASLLSILGIALLVHQRATLFGMDFTGGFALNVELMPDQQGAYAHRLEEALLAQGLTPKDFQLRELHPSHHLRLFFNSHLDQLANPSSRLAWVTNTLQTQNLQLAPASLPLQWTTMSGQMSESMQTQAILGLLIAFAAIFFYIVIRFEYKFAIAAILCLLHDVLVTLSILSLLHYFGMPLQIDLHTVAALMTIIGYSLNDTIIIFDRIREDMHLSPNAPLAPLVNRALNTTLSRTTITSGTTLLVLIALVAFGGASIFSFSFVMLVGVIVGTLSSWFIASPLMLYFQTKEITNVQETS